ANDNAGGAREVEAHLAGAAADLDDARVAVDRAVEQAREGAAVRSRAQALEAVTRRVARKRRAFVEAPHRLGASIARQPQARDAVRRVEASVTTGARPVRRQPTSARRTGEEIAERVHCIRRSRR